jgi:hypothetical protein
MRRARAAPDRRKKYTASARCQYFQKSAKTRTKIRINSIVAYPDLLLIVIQLAKS